MKNICKSSVMFIVFILCQLSCVMGLATNVIDDKGLTQLIQPIKPWPPFRETTNYTNDDWDRLLTAAKTMQNADPMSVERALDNWRDDKIVDLPVDSDNMVKIYILLKMLFELPEHAPATERFRFGSWEQNMFSNASPRNEDGTVNLGWPIALDSGAPRFVSGFQGYEGPRYDPAKEYHYLLGKYGFRNLEKIPTRGAKKPK